MIARTRHLRSSESGGILVVAMLTIGALALVATATLCQVGNRHATSYHSLSWNEALASAEAGADAALQAMNDSINNPSAWAAWTPGDASTFPKTWNPTISNHGGEGNQKVFTSVTVDNDLVDANGQRWMRVRTTGVAEISGSSRAGIESAPLNADGTKNSRGALRKIKFTGDITGGALRLPQVARRIEAIAAPIGSRTFVRALTVLDSISVSGNTVMFDSFDSTDANKSTGGRYDAAKSGTRGDIATNASGTLISLGNATIMGSVSSNGGTIGGSRVAAYTNFSATLPPVAAPVWGTVNLTPDFITNPPGGMTLIGGPQNAPQNYKITDLTISDASNRLVLAPHSPGTQSYINIWVTGLITVTGTGFIEQMPGVHVTIHGEREMNFSGAGYVNQSGRAADLQIFGIDPSIGNSRITVSASNDFIGVIHAPAFELIVSGYSSFMGAATAFRASVDNLGGFHYDESLGQLASGPVTGYQFASWVEDIR